MTEWAVLAEAIARQRDAGGAPHFWLRDDDAVSPTVPLDRLLALTGRFGVPSMLAVIPAFAGDALAERLEGSRDVAVAVHGWSHENHALPGEKKQELVRHRPAATVLAELGTGFAKLHAAHGSRFTPILVPPWNRIAPELIPDLPGLGFAALSAFGPLRPAAIRMSNTTVDIMDWHNGRKCRPHAELTEEIAGQLRAGLGSQERPIGLLTHHLVHDEAAWSFMEGLFKETAARGCRWLTAEELLASDPD